MSQAPMGKQAPSLSKSSKVPTLLKLAFQWGRQTTSNKQKKIEF